MVKYHRIIRIISQDRFSPQTTFLLDLPQLVQNIQIITAELVQERIRCHQLVHLLRMLPGLLPDQLLAGDDQGLQLGYVCGMLTPQG